MCHRSVGLILNRIEEAAISTVSITLKPELTFFTGVSRAGYLRYPLGNPFGPANNVEEQRSILLDVLELVQLIKEPGTIMEMPYRWRKGRIK